MHDVFKKIVSFLSRIIGKSKNAKCSLLNQWWKVGKKYIKFWTVEYHTDTTWKNESDSGGSYWTTDKKENL